MTLTTTVRLAVPTDPMSHLVHLINQAYQVGEKDILVDTAERPFQRVTDADLQQFVQAQQLLVVTTMTTGGGVPPAIVGCIKVQGPSPNDSNSNDDQSSSSSQGDQEVQPFVVGEWGCMAVALSHQQNGLGGQLVDAAEQHLRIQYQCTHAKLELLAPTHWKHAHKEMLRTWYTGSGYQLQVPGNYEASTQRLPAGAPLGGRFVLATDADFTSYYKKL